VESRLKAQEIKELSSYRLGRFEKDLGTYSLLGSTSERVPERESEYAMKAKLDGFDKVLRKASAEK